MQSFGLTAFPFNYLLIIIGIEFIIFFFLWMYRWYWDFFKRRDAGYRYGLIDKHNVPDHHKMRKKGSGQ